MRLLKARFVERFACFFLLGLQASELVFFGVELCLRFPQQAHLFPCLLNILLGDGDFLVELVQLALKLFKGSIVLFERLEP